MNSSKLASIVSCFGIPGLIIAAIMYCVGDEKSSKYYLVQSLNATICGLAAELVAGLIGAIFGGGYIAGVCGALASIYGFALFVQILVSAIKQSRSDVYGMVPVVQND